VKLKAALSSRNVERMSKYTDDLLAQINGARMKVKKLTQATILVSSVKRKLADKIPKDEKKRIEEAIENLEGAPYEDVTREMDKLKEIVNLLETEYGDK